MLNNVEPVTRLSWVETDTSTFFFFMLFEPRVNVHSFILPAICRKKKKKKKYSVFSVIVAALISSHQSVLTPLSGLT